MRTIDGLYVTKCMCFPRSGHHLLVSLLTAYFEGTGQFHYCEKYIDPITKRIGPDSNTNFEKDHDNENDTPILPDLHYLVQIRDPLQSLGSRWDLAVRCGSKANTPAEWREGMKEWLPMWTAFFWKWIAPEISNRLIVRYESLVQDPFRTTCNVIEWLQGKPNIDREKLYQVIEKVRPEAKRKVVFPFHVVA